MNLQDALRMYRLPYDIVETIDGDDMVTYRLRPTSASATRQKLKSRLNDLMDATDQRMELILEDGVSIRIKKAPKIYRWMDYSGYIDFSDEKIPFIVGFSNGQIKMDTMADAVHMLIGGTTGSGKSVFLHNLITTFACNPNNYLYLVDCKFVEFGIYKDSAMVSTEMFGENSVAQISSYLVDEMERRYRFMAEHGLSEFSEFKKRYPNERRHILVIDELSDLISDKKGRDILVPRLLRLAQKGRASGIHVILATQRPDSSVINGTLKENLPTKCSFRTSSSVSSRIILDQGGAEMLQGHGDGLYKRSTSMFLERIQAPYISMDDIRSIA